MVLRQTIKFCSSRDGTRIAVASVGSGPPLLRAAHWLSHVEYDLESPIWRPWLTAFSERNTYVRYDQRGCGLSDRQPADISFDAWLADLEAVADTIDQRSFPLLGMSQGGALAIAFALRHPERVSHLILFGAYARGAHHRATNEAERLEAKTLVDLIRVGWGRDNPAFRQVFTSLFIPGGTAEQHRWWNDLERISTSPEIAALTLEQLHQIDVTAMAAQLRVPTLVLHARGDARVPFEEGRKLAGLIQNARFVPLESSNHTLLPSEPAWLQFLAEIRSFLTPEAETLRRPSVDRAGLTAAEAEVLALVAAGLDNRAIAGQLGKAEKTVRNQLSSILDKLGVRSRAEAIVLALKD
ncbi:alpha/beta fold hydrolase [Mesorhizobium sp. ASY16-5R]|uniref:alpha/beta fold hydrolase n=1 Tax=Mesorhizobium sp. ASY16-5R TaxID=3445772 RepID=UPI003FA13BE6